MPDAGKVDGQVGGLLRRHLRRGLHQAQHQGRHENAGCGEHDAQQERQHHGGVHRLPHLFLPLGAVILADDHARAAGEAKEKADQRIDHRPYRAHGGKRLVADVVAHHPGIHHVVELLKKIAHHQRQGKVDQMLCDAALRHVHVITGGAVVGVEVQMQMAGMAHGGSPCNILLYRNFTIIPAGAQQGECRFFGADSAAEWAGMDGGSALFREFRPVRRTHDGHLVGSAVGGDAVDGLSRTLTVSLIALYNKC